MARLTRIVIPNIPHHITQRGIRSQNVFFSDNDKGSYISLLHRHAKEAGISFLGYCFMDNHVDLIAVIKK